MFLGVDAAVLVSAFTVGPLDFEASPTALTLKGVRTGSVSLIRPVLSLLVLLLGGLTLLWLGYRRAAWR
jgi:hypothetical protein